MGWSRHGSSHLLRLELVGILKGWLRGAILHLLLWRVPARGEVLTRWDHAHIHILLMRSLYLLLLLLQQLYLLLYRELFHWEAVSDGLADIDDGISMTTTVGAVEQTERQTKTYFQVKKTYSSEESALTDFCDEQCGVCGLLGPGHPLGAVESAGAP